MWDSRFLQARAFLDPRLIHCSESPPEAPDNNRRSQQSNPGNSGHATPPGPGFRISPPYACGRVVRFALADSAKGPVCGCSTSERERCHCSNYSTMSKGITPRAGQTTRDSRGVAHEASIHETGNNDHVQEHDHGPLNIRNNCDRQRGHHDQPMRTDIRRRRGATRKRWRETTNSLVRSSSLPLPSCGTL